jgi:hypothetical protein
MHAFKQFIEGNRQTGSTTALVKAAIEAKGDIVVSNMDIASKLTKTHPEMRGHIYTYMDIQNGAWRGNKERPIFFDTSVIWDLVSAQERAAKRPVVIGLCHSCGYDGYLPMDDAPKFGGRAEIGGDAIDGYAAGKHTVQFNVKLTKEDEIDVKNINADFFEGEASNSMLGRILLRKGIQFYKKLRMNF